MNPDLLILRLRAMKVTASKKPRGAARETWDVGYNDALEDVIGLLQSLSRDEMNATPNATKGAK